MSRRSRRPAKLPIWTGNGYGARTGNPAVDYRLPGGLTLHDTGLLLRGLLSTGIVIGMSISIFNPWLDPAGEIATNLARCVNKPLQEYLRVP